MTSLMSAWVGRVRRRLGWKQRHGERLSRTHQQFLDLSLYHWSTQNQRSAVNPLNAFGRKCYSQADEDGITLEILRRIDCLGPGVFAEFGVGDGTENNTLVLAAMGWKGFWVGGSEIRPRIDSTNQRFSFIKNWITLENIVALAEEGLKAVQGTQLDVLSLDLDGNDRYFIDALLTGGIRPKLFIAEYNAKFPPPVRFCIAYDAQHRWREDDYFGASLSSLNDLFVERGYRLVCCNAWTGVNAFFVDKAYSDRFADIPRDVTDLYMAPTYWAMGRFGHKVSLRTVERVLNHVES